jgi:phosphocarrier protein
MPSRTVVVGSAVGLHARPASVIAAAAAKHQAPITLRTREKGPVDAASALLIMTLGAEQGVEVTVESPDEAAVEEIAALVAADLDAA